MPTDQNADRRRMTRRTRSLTLGVSGVAAAAAAALSLVIAGHNEATNSGGDTVTGTTASTAAGTGDASRTSVPTAAAPSNAGSSAEDSSAADSSTATDQGIFVTPAPLAGGPGGSHAGSGGS